MTRRALEIPIAAAILVVGNVERAHRIVRTEAREVALVTQRRFELFVGSLVFLLLERLPRGRKEAGQVPVRRRRRERLGEVRGSAESGPIRSSRRA